MYMPWSGSPLGRHTPWGGGGGEDDGEGRLVL